MWLAGLNLLHVALTFFFSHASWEAKDGMKRNLLLAMSAELSSVELIPVDLEEGRMGLPSILEYLCGPSDPVACLSLPHWQYIGHLVCKAHWGSPVFSCEPSPSLQPSLHLLVSSSFASHCLPLEPKSPLDYACPIE